MKIAVISGASSGLGREMALRVKTEFPDIESLWLIARRRDRLEKLAGEIKGLKCEILGLDISTREGIAAYADKLKAEKPEVALLINNAGFGKLGDFDSSDMDEQLGMVDVNVRGLTGLARATLDYMPRGSKMINISSIASFVPNARMAVYCATKYYVRGFSRALGMELKPRGITVTAVCPGPMSTEFLDVAGIGTNSHTFNVLPRIAPGKVAAGALRSAKKGRPVYTPGAFYKFYRVISAIIPDTLLMHAART